jgi:DNA-directed RNA polymerase specialized sigma24 family protein
MSAAQTVTKYLPYLRRYARALTGSQTSGDAYVAATLEALIKEPSLLGEASQPKVALF